MANSSASSTTTSKDNFIKRGFNKVTETVVNKVSSPVKTIGKKVGKAVLIGVGAKVAVSAVEGYTGYDVDWHIDGENNGYGVALKDSNSVVEVSDRSDTTNNDTYLAEAYINTKPSELDYGQTWADVKVGNMCSNSSRYEGDMFDKASDAVNSVESTMSGAFAQSESEVVNNEADTADVEISDDTITTRELADENVQYSDSIDSLELEG